MNVFFYKIQNYFLKKLSYISRMPSDGNSIYLTFDDGPEPGITEFVLDELDKYGFKATFFCRGDNAEKNQNLLALLREKGHTIGNHSFSHLHAYDVSSRWYADDVNHAEELLHSQWLRPPHGSLTFVAWWVLHQKYKIVFWSLNSNDFARDSFNLEQSMSILKSKTHPGDIVLFHFCHKHERETRQILPPYLKWLSEHRYIGKSL